LSHVHYTFPLVPYVFYYIFSKKAVFLAKMVVHFSEKNRIYAKVILAGLFYAPTNDPASMQ